jgi:hypothetical protein
MTKASLNNSTRAGQWIQQQAGPEAFACFYPTPLLPDPPIQHDTELQNLQERTPLCQYRCVKKNEKNCMGKSEAG